ncbi:MAG: EAL domain-containing protein, partial [Tepidimonas sp.]|uniref:bifunctional diguanylate cyclase/phosphodiesterase n=1 Tax=Tepidimonas sp. TaxID=2002775 RepID=UPI00259F6F55
MSVMVAAGIVWPMAEQAASNAFDSFAKEADARLQAELGSAPAALQIFGHALQLQPVSVDEPRPFIERARRAMQAMPLVTSIVVGNDAGQGWLMLWRSEQREWLVRLTDRGRWGDEHQFFALDEQGRVLRGWRERLAYDPRERPWYRLALDAPGSVRWTDPYVLFTTREPGITAAVAWQDAGGAFWAVGFDLRANEIDALTKALPIGPRSVALVIDEQGRVLGQSHAALALQPTSEGGWRLPRVDDVAHPILSQVLSSAGLSSGTTEPTQRTRAVGPLDNRWLVAPRAVTLGDHAFVLWLAAPWRDFVPDLVRWLAMLGVFGAAAALGAAWLARRSARRLVEPVEYLAAAAREVGQSSAIQLVRTDWTIAELNVLARSLNDSRRRLRIFHRQLKRREAQLQREVQALGAAEQKLVHVGLHDPLTDLPNRRLLLERIPRALARSVGRGASMAVCYLNLDRFQEINEGWGHECGDTLLVQVAQRLSRQLRGGDTLARLGADEFVLVLEEVTSDSALQSARAVLATLEPPFDIDGHRFHISASIGISLAPRDGQDALALLRCASVAMHRAKSTGRARIEMYQAGFAQRTNEAREMREALAHAIEERKIELWWQPQVDLRDGRIVAAEGLMRWNHPRWGWVPPSTFIPLAEDGGLIERLGLLVLDLAIEHGQQLDTAGWTLDRLAINVSALQLQRDDFDAQVLRRLDRSGWPARRLELEITESVLLDSDEARERLKRLETHGVRLAVDDFGTGYASLAYLRSLPLDVLKIDASFVRDIGTSPQADALIESLIQLGHAVGLELLAEGVETEAQRAFLAARAVPRAQGYLWSPARPLNDWL